MTSTSPSSKAARANIPAAGKAGIASRFAFVNHRPGLPELVKQKTVVTWVTTILVLALVLTGCGKTSNRPTAVPADPITRFVARYSNIQGSIVWSPVGAPFKMSAEEALATLRTNGVRMPNITNMSLVEMRAFRPEDPHLAIRLTNCVAALVDTEIGQKIILLREFPGEREWHYHVFDAK